VSFDLATVKSAYYRLLALYVAALEDASALRSYSEHRTRDDHGFSVWATATPPLGPVVRVLVHGHIRRRLGDVERALRQARETLRPESDEVARAWLAERCDDLDRFRGTLWSLRLPGLVTLIAVAPAAVTAAAKARGVHIASETWKLLAFTYGPYLLAVGGLFTWGFRVKRAIFLRQRPFASGPTQVYSAENAVYAALRREKPREEQLDLRIAALAALAGFDGALSALTFLSGWWRFAAIPPAGASVGCFLVYVKERSRRAGLE
jgi:hypothetical protein